MSKQNGLLREKLDQIVLDIEFLLISVVQGVAVVTLGESSIEPISHMDFSSILYVISAFLLIIIFWSQAIIHAISFVEWPIDLRHSFLYFFVGLLEVMAFNQMSDPLKWFGIMTFLFASAGLVYILDLDLIKKHEQSFKGSKEKIVLYKHILDRQFFEMKFFVPLGIIFNLVSFTLIFNFREFFIDQNYHLILIGLQIIFSGFVIRSSLNSFKERTMLISKNIKNE